MTDDRHGVGQCVCHDRCVGDWSVTDVVLVSDIRQTWCGVSDRRGVSDRHGVGQ